MFTRALQPIPTTRRAYSSFFSSKPGGGRFFNSTKPPKTLVNAAKSKPDNTHAASDGAVSGAGSASGSGSSKLKTTAGEESSHERPPPAVTNGAATRDRPSQTSHNASTSSTMTAPLRLTSPPSTSSSHIFRHPLMSPEDYKLHQFFSLHRPLLLHAQPTSAIFEPPPQPLHLFVSPPSKGEVPRRPAHLGTLDDPPEPSAEADADTVRQLARALVVNRVGGTISWEDTLARLGFDGNAKERTAELAKEWARELDTIHADSVKRKRKKKMKKHK
jgi:hypothetical protein